MSTAYLNGEHCACYALGLQHRVKYAAPDQDTGVDASQERSYLPAAAGIGAGLLAAGGLYHHMRTPTPTNNPALQKIRDRAGDKFTRVLETKTPETAAGRLFERIHLGGGDAPHYLGDLPPEELLTPPKSIKRLPGAVHYNDATRADYVQGDVPAGMMLSDYNLSNELLRNKWKEYNYINKHAPGTLAPTENLKDIINELKLTPPGNDREAAAHLTALQNALRTRYGDGYVMKEVSGVQSSGMFPSERDNFNDLLANYRNSGAEKEFQEGMKDVVKGTYPGAEGPGDSLPLYRKLKQSPHYHGRVLELALKDPESVIVQQRVPIAKSNSRVRKALSGLTKDDMSNEMRVHVENGKVVPNLTFPRFSPLGYAFDHEHLAGASDHVQSIIDKLPADTKRMSFAMDVVPLEGGGYQVIETNPTGNSGLLHGKTSIPGSGIHLRKHYLGNYAKPVAGMAAGAAGLGVGGATALGANYLQDRQKRHPPETETP